MFHATALRPVQRVLLALLPLLLLLAATLSPNPAALAAEGDLDIGFIGATHDGINNLVNEIALQPDGKAIIGGNFTSVNGVTRTRLARLHTDGSLDSSFAPGGGANGAVSALHIQPDGKILVGGSFTTVNNVSRNYIARLQPTGGLDSSFLPNLGANSDVYAIAMQPDGKILIGGNFTTSRASMV